MDYGGLILGFDRGGVEDHPFTMGFEMGRLWEQLKDEDGFEQMVHSENVEMVMRMRESTGRDMRIEDTDQDEWMLLVVGEVL